MRKNYFAHKVILVTFLGTSLLVSSVFPAKADTLQQQLNQSQQRQNQLNAELKAQQDKIADVMPQIEALRDSVEALNGSIAREQKRLDEEKSNLKELEKEQEKLEKQKQEYIETLGQFVKNSHEDGVASYLEMLFDASSISDFVDRADKIQVIVGSYSQLQKDIDDVNAALEDKKFLIQEKQDKIQASITEKERTQQTAQQTLDKQEAILAQLNKEEKAALNAALAAKNDVDKYQRMIAHEERERAYYAQDQSSSSSSAKSSGGGGVTGTVKVSGGAQGILAEAGKHVGTPYVWGGTSPSGFDCSGFVQYVYRVNGVSLSRVSEQQFNNGVSISQSELRAGDLVFFSTYHSGASHVGIYVGNNVMIHSGNSGVSYTDITSSYYGPRYLGARRVLAD